MGQEALVGIYCFVGMLILVLVGIPVFIPLLIAAIAGFWIIAGPTFALEQATTATYNITASYAFAVVPMFVLMGIIAGESGIAEDAYNAASKWVMKVRGGLLMATIGANAVFGACSGIPTGGTIVFTKIAVPQLDKYGYDKRLSMACIASAAVLITLIPPSMPIIITSILVNISIGRALIAGIVPGILLAIMLSLTVWIVGVINPKRMPVATDIRVTWRERFASLKLLWPMIFLFVLMMGGMYAGVFPPTVGGAIGAAGILVYALAMRRMNKRQLFNAFWDSVVLNGQLFPMLIGGMIFARLVALSGLAQGFNDFLISVQMPPLGIMAIVLIFYLILGCVMDLTPIIIITLPIVFPILTTGLGYDPYAVVIILLFMGAIGSITPPIGMSCIIVAIAAETDVMEVYRGILPFFFVQLAIVVLLIFFPAIASWLPNLFMQ
jgi:tripartite ATP-independent transporter DctM subunit